MKLGIPVYEGVNLLDVAGPLEMFFWAGRDNPLETVLVSENGRAVTSVNGVRFEVGAAFADVSNLDVLWVPGGDPHALEREMTSADTPYLAYLRHTAQGARWVCSVCEGALLLARAGLLDGYQATTHWRFIECLKRFHRVDVDTRRERFVVSGNRLTGAGISAGLDEALALIKLLFGEAAAMKVQSTTEYFPRPPVMGTLPPGAPRCMVEWPSDN